MKKILLIDDSALTRRILCDIIEDDGRFSVADQATNGLAALDLMEKNKYDGIILDINMPKMNGLEFLAELKKRGRVERIIVVSTDTADGATVTIQALELGAFDFIQKPKNTLDSRKKEFRDHFFAILEAAVRAPIKRPEKRVDSSTTEKKILTAPRKSTGGNKLVAIACSTGGPKALQSIIPRLPDKIDAPILIVQHMPVGFTKSLAERLDHLSSLSVKEAQEDDVLMKGHVYLARGGMHLKYEEQKGRGRLIYSDEPSREGVKPSANYLYESLELSSFDEIICVVLTGMGADGTQGILNLAEYKKLHIIAQEENSCTVYGMPKSIVATGKVDQIVELDQIAQEILTNVGVR
ncbi:MAG TPA: chemotaxis-specific protein-glutamate methyltransferase CheB [Lachnospiraceae bacterium]|nr:chemotaxis-specific protein-glutamate methyltransferase CheB [Lachnospiraceae bacterium]HPF28730.1 chemotaxis-specific protein-glutamate methyltransferase CheB [Lachnospiraceae bacterium]